MRITARHSAFTLIEAVVMMVIVSLVAVAVGVGLQSTARMPEATDRSLAVWAELNSELDNWHAAAWSVSPWPGALPYNPTPDTVTIKVGGQNIVCSRTITVQNWDPNNLTSNASPQSDFARVQITINGQTGSFFTCKPL